MRAIAYAIIALVALQRLFEVVYAARNTARLKQRGAIEVGAGHYPLIVLLHIAWLAAIALALPRPLTISWTLIALMVLLQALRAWVLVTLGPYWTTRILTVPDAPLVSRGPYRFVRHPNYLVVVAEILVLPLAFAEWWVAAVFTLLNAAMLSWRIHLEDLALKDRRGLGEAGAAAAKD
ncbi:MAG: hypothetical protein JO261_03130 [Alphaproteobacteria bacterium]|nr:hypothetical protein [Alphaproteobacteria bacterium]MBV9692673.1 hypothetical protein [Alphaproteobacteria bacterium]